MPSVTITPVSTGRDLQAFIDLPWKIYAGNSYWVPPLKRMVKTLLDKSRHPFWEFSDQLLLLARRGSEPVGRIAGIIDRNFNRYHSTAMGAWGFFECVEDVEVAKALFDTLDEWVSSNGMTVFRGPFNPSTNYEIGLLIEGFDKTAGFMMPYNPPYYIRLVEECGFRKEKDLLSLIGYRDSYKPPEWLTRLADRFRDEGRLTIRAADVSRPEEELALAWSLYEECWSQNWGFVPVTEAEFRETTSNLRRIGDPNLLAFVYWDGEPIGVALSVPDVTPILKHLNGKLGLLGLIKAWLHRKEIQGVRGLLFGIKNEYRDRGVPFVVLDFTLEMLKKGNYQYLELGWNLEDNDAINQLETHFGAQPFRRYRIYRKWFADRW